MKVRVLGPLEAERDGASIAVGGPQQRRLFAVLVLHRGRATSTERLVDALWPDGDAPEGAARSIRTYVSRLRAVLPDGAITSNGAGYALDRRSYTLDADEFNDLLDAAERAVPEAALAHYEDALSRWQGLPYGEFTDEWWAIAESTSLNERRLLGEERHAALLMSMGHHARAVPELERLVAEQPLRERPVLLLLQALHVTGRRAEALRAGAAFRSRLGQGTGLAPSTELAQLELLILKDDELGTTLLDRPLRGYVLHTAIGEGGHGRVYEATQPATDRRVAIKVIRPELADATEFVRRFDAEARLIARLEHPHIVPLYDYWREPGGAYLVFRLLTGGTARDSIVSGGPWSVDRVSGLVEEIGGALIASHAAGVVHNDVKSSNVLLDGSGAAFLTDFGIALAIDDSGRSIEMAAEHGDVADLARLIWELLVGSPPPVDAPDHGAVLPRLVGRVADPPPGIDALLQSACVAEGGVASVAEFVLGWRAATGSSGVRTPLTSIDRRRATAARRGAARDLAIAVTAGTNPYRGLSSFDEADAERFHGRDAVVDELVAAVETRPMVVVVGASGSGKSSVVRAGLVPRLRAGGAVVATMVPGDDPLDALREACRDLETTDDQSIRADDALAAVARRLGRLVVVVDQLEECWTRATLERRSAFIDVVANIAGHPGVDIRVVATVRADLLDRPLADPCLGPLVSVGAFVLPPLTPAELADAIEAPAEHVGVGFEEGVVADLVGEAVAQPGSLPLLQFCLTELYDRRVDGAISRRALDEIGGMAGAVGWRAENVYGSLDGEQQSDARDLFARLIVPERGLVGARRRARIGDLTDGMRTVSDRFVQARLLVTDRDPATREPTIEIAHEALLVRWPRLADWADEDAQWLEQVQHLASAARTWHEGGRGDADLYRGTRLEAALEATDEGRVVAPLEQEFLDTGRRARDADLIGERRTNRRLRRRLVAVAAVLVVALVAGVLAFAQRRQAQQATDDARIEALVGQVASLRSTQRDTAALVAIEAFRLADTPRTRAALFSTFTDDERFLDAHRFDAVRGTSGIVMPDGATAYLTDQDGRQRAYDLDTGAVAHVPLPAVGDDPYAILSASPDGGLLVVAARSDPIAGPTTVAVIDTETAALAFAPTTIDGAATAAVFLPRDRVAVALGEGGEVVVLDAQSGAQLAGVPAIDIDPDEIIWTSDPILRRPSGVAVAGDELMVGSGDGTVRVLDIETFEPHRSFERPAQTTSSLWPLADGSVVTAGRFGVAMIDAATGGPDWEHAEFGRCLNLAIAEEAGRFYCGDAYGRLEERDLVDGAVVRHLDAQDGRSSSLWLADGGAELVSFGRDEPVVSRWRLDGSGPITRLVAPGWTPEDFDPLGDRLLVSRGDVYQDTYQAALVDLADGASTPLEGPVVASWTDDGSLIGLWYDAGGEVEFARSEPVGSGRSEVTVTGVPLGRSDDIAEFGVNSGKRRMLIRYRSEYTDEFTTFDTATLTYGATITIEGEFVSAGVNRAGDRVVAGTERGVVVYDAESGHVIDSIDVPDLRAVAVTAADQLFVGSLGGELTQYDLDTLTPTREMAGSRGLLFGGSSTLDGALAALHSGDRVATLLDVDSGTRIGTISIAPDTRNIARLSLDGRWLAVGGQPLSSDDVVATAHDDMHAIQIWDLDPAAWVTAACGVAGRDLTSTEWETYVGDLAPYRRTCTGG
jgi:DNA-binding SARP family transcriptional activator/tRNA A-37 threonylcarbamoyl transferase component Bud32